MYKKMLWVVAVVFSLAISQTAFAWDCGGGIKKMVESLKIDDAQKEKIKPILDEFKSSMKDNWSQMKGLDTQMQQQMDSANMDQSAVDGLIDQKTKLIANMMKAKTKAQGQIGAILTPEQKTELQGKMKKVEEEMAEKFKDCHDHDD